MGPEIVQMVYLFAMGFPMLLSFGRLLLSWVDLFFNFALKLYLLLLLYHFVVTVANFSSFYIVGNLYEIDLLLLETASNG